MKKAIYAILTVIFVFTLACGCTRERDTVNIYVPDGAPALAVANLLEKEQLGGRKISVTVTTGENVRAQILDGTADVALCPTNMAATLYNNGAEYKLLSANTFGLLYMVGKPDFAVTSLTDLVGKVVHTIGRGNVPEFVLKRVLSANDIAYEDSDVAVEGKVALKYYSAGSAILPLLKSGEIEIALLGEPAATKSGAKELFDLQQLWREATGLGNYPQAGCFVSNALLADETFVSALSAALKDNETFLSDNVSDVAALLVRHGSSDLNGTTFTMQLLQRCNVYFKKASECKADLVAYFDAIRTVAPTFVLPDDGFYFG